MALPKLWVDDAQGSHTGCFFEERTSITPLSERFVVGGVEERSEELHRGCARSHFAAKHHLALSLRPCTRGMSSTPSGHKSRAHERLKALDLSVWVYICTCACHLLFR